jgi:hypothetical protein
MSLATTFCYLTILSTPWYYLFYILPFSQETAFCQVNSSFKRMFKYVSSKIYIWSSALHCYQSDSKENQVCCTTWPSYHCTDPLPSLRGLCCHYIDPILIVIWTSLSSHRPFTIITWTHSLLHRPCCYCTDLLSSLHRCSIFVAWMLYYHHVNLPSSLCRCFIIIAWTCCLCYADTLSSLHGPTIFIA